MPGAEHLESLSMRLEIIGPECDRRVGSAIYVNDRTTHNLVLVVIYGHVISQDSHSLSVR